MWPMIQTDDTIYNLLAGVMSVNLSFNDDSASSEILDTSFSQVGMSWINPMTWPAVQT